MFRCLSLLLRRACLGLWLAPLPALAQEGSIPDEVMGWDRPEAWAMKYFAAAGLMQSVGGPLELNAGQLAGGFELSNLPHLSKAKRTVGFNGIKEENLNKAPLLARPYLHYGITSRLSLTATYVPPLEVFDRLETHLAGLSVNYTVLRGERYRFGLRGYSQWTQAEGDFTGPEESAGSTDPAVNPYGVEKPSSDVFTSWTSTLEANFAWLLPLEHPTSVYLNTAYSYADLDFEIDVTYFGGFRDNRHQVTDGWIWSWSAGVETQLTESISLAGGIFYAPLSVRRPPDFSSRNDALLNFRVLVNIRL